jgi:hypothetical protein
MRVRGIIILIIAVLTLMPFALLADAAPNNNLKMTQGTGGPMEYPTVSVPFYEEHTFLVLTGFAIALAGFVVFRMVRRRWGRKVRPLAFANEAILVLDVVDSTHLTTHYGTGLAMRAMTLLEERTLAAAETRGLSFVKNTGDGSLMVFPSVTAAVETAIDLLRELADQQSDFSLGPPLAVRAGISYGEILFD